MEKRKSILFVAHGLGIGGIEKCLVNLLNAMPEQRYEIDVLLMNPEYTFVPCIRREINLLDNFEYILSTDITRQEIRKRGGYLRHLDKIFPYICHRMRIALKKPRWPHYKRLEKHYDVAVCYSQTYDGPYYVIDMVTADRKVLWYHNGAYEIFKTKYPRDQQYYPQYDQIVAVSQDCKAMLAKQFPQIREKLLVLKNLCDVADVREKAKAFIPETFWEGPLHIVTVGRMETEKGADLALEVCRMLREEGLDICWHWVGGGSCTEAIRSKAVELGLRDRFLLEGNRENPYPYIACGDIYVQPSYYEAYSTTVTEARVLYRPIVATDVGGMRDQIRDGETGRIVDIGAEAIAQGIRELAENGELRAAFTEALRREDLNAGNALEEYEKTVFA